MKDLQRKVNKWIGKYSEGYWKPHEILARLMEEVGELAREINHHFGPKKKKSSEEPKELGDEIADVIFTVICLANSLNIDLDKYLQRVIIKYGTRDKDRWKRKSK